MDFCVLILFVSVALTNSGNEAQDTSTLSSSAAALHFTVSSHSSSDPIADLSNDTVTVPCITDKILTPTASENSTTTNISTTNMTATPSTMTTDPNASTTTTTTAPTSSNTTTAPTASTTTTAPTPTTTTAPTPSTTTMASTPSTTTSAPTAVITRASLKCENNGLEKDGVCLCEDQWTGKDCSIENFCKEGETDGYHFPQTAVGLFAYSTELCDKNTSAADKPISTTRCVKLSNGSTEFQSPPQVLNCSLTLTDIQQSLGDQADLEQLASSTQILTSVPEELTPGNVTTAAEIANKLLKLSNTTGSVKVAAIATVSQLLSAETTSDTNQNNATLGLTLTLGNLSVNFSKDANSSESKVVQPNLVLQSAQVPAVGTQGVQFTSFEGKSGRFIADRVQLNLNASQVDMGNELAGALIYINFTTGSIDRWRTASNVSLGFVLYQNDRFFRTERSNTQWSSVRVLAGRVDGEGVVPDHVELHFRPRIENGTSLHDYACVFWDYSLGDWSVAGCNKVNSNMTLGCFCNHTTNFAALWSYREQYQYSYLDYISTTGLIVSAVALVITIVHHLRQNICKTTRDRQGNLNAKLVLLYIYSTLLAFILIFLCGADNHHRSYEGRMTQLDLESNKIPESSRRVEQDAGPCTAVTALLHYFLLATFLWNSIYGTQLVLLIWSLRNHLPASWTRLSHVVGWGLPAVVMAITLGATYSVDNPLNYRQEEFCWLAGMDRNKHFDYAKPMFWGFLLPVGLILVYNTVLLVVIAMTTCKTDPKLRSTKQATLCNKFLICFSLAVLLGLSWSLGYLVLVLKGQVHHALTIIFCICQTTQGLQIFFFFTARTPTFRAALRHSGHMITSASFARTQTYHLWKNFKNALSFESYKKT